jgi:hypothetical protein
MKSPIALAAAITAAAAVTPSSALASSGFARPDDRAVGPRALFVTTVGSPADLGHVRPDDRAVGSRSAGLSVRASTPIVVRVTRPGFDWGDAGVGAGAGAGLVLLVLGGSLLVRHGKDELRTA